MTWTIDPAHSRIEFSIRHMMITCVCGRFTRFEGCFDIDPADLTASCVTGTIDVASIDTGVAQRDIHLRSIDFFDVDQHPAMKFQSTRIEPVGADQYQVAGRLTIQATTQEIVFDVTDEGRGQDPWGNQRWGLSATARLDRRDFGLTWNMLLETGGWLIGNEVKIKADVQLVKELQPKLASVIQR